VLGRDDLIASYYTLTGTPVGQAPRFTFTDRVRAAAEAGFAGIGLLADDYEAQRRAGAEDEDLCAVLADHGVRVAELEFHFDWAVDSDNRAETRRREATLHAMADAFAPHHLNVGDLNAPGDAPELEVIADRFGALCDRAAEHGTRVALEFLPWTAIPDLRAAHEIVRRAARRNGGVLIDAWHYFRGTPDPGFLRTVSPEDVAAVQLDDADRDPVGPLFEDTMFRRRLPGDGAFDLVGLVTVLDEIGVDVPYSVEIMSTDEQARPVGEAARRAHDATRAVLARARPAAPA
jgi:sugar phosphate isomerase/epimerase